MCVLCGWVYGCGYVSDSVSESYVNVRIKFCVVCMYIEGTFRLNCVTNINQIQLLFTLQEHEGVKISV